MYNSDIKNYIGLELLLVSYQIKQIKYMYSGNKL